MQKLNGAVVAFQFYPIHIIKVYEELIMLRQNRYKDNDFIHSPQELKIMNDEILVSKKHDIVISLEPYQVEKIEDIKEFILKLINAIPMLDNQTQDYYEKISNDTDFPHSLSIIYIEETCISLDYWSDSVNNQFTINFCFENNTWILKKWNEKEVPHNWQSLPNK